MNLQHANKPCNIIITDRCYYCTACTLNHTDSISVSKQLMSMEHVIITYQRFVFDIRSFHLYIIFIFYLDITSIFGLLLKLQGTDGIYIQHP